MTGRLGRHTQFLVAAATGIAAFAAASIYRLDLAHTIGANAFFVVYLGMVLTQMPRMTPGRLRRNARDADLPVLVIYAVTIGVVTIAVTALFVLINADRAPDAFAMVFALLSLPLGWATIHTMAALHYAHLYWVQGDGKDGQHRPAGGLAFAGDEEPDGFDFLYFAVTIGMTAQTADVAIASSRMRKVVLVHAALSFFFNTVLVAAAVNIAVQAGN